MASGSGGVLGAVNWGERSPFCGIPTLLPVATEEVAAPLLQQNLAL